MAAWWSGPVPTFLAADPAQILDRLTACAAQQHRIVERHAVDAWRAGISILRAALAALHDAARWQVLLEFGIARLGSRADAVLVGPHGIIVLEFKFGATRFDPVSRRQVEDYALDIQDFHAASRRHPIVPILVATEARAPQAGVPLMIAGAASVVDSDPQTLATLLGRIASAFPETARPIDVREWERAHYAPVPGIVDAARALFRRHDVAEIASARADADELHRTIATIARLLEQAREAARKIVVFVTGSPGAGKTFCGLAIAFAHERLGNAAFLTGNPTLVHVLREALVRDAVRAGGQRQASARRMKSVIQALPQFRDHYVGTGHVPSECVVVIDEAQRSWNAAQAVAKSRARPVQLSMSEPAHLLDVMARHTGFAALICLVGNGQEIHDGEGGIAEWGAALATRPEWQAVSAETILAHPVERCRLQHLANHTPAPALHLAADRRALRGADVSAFVDALLAGDAAAASAHAAAQGGVPFRMTRSLAALRAGLRAACRDVHRAGLVASAGARRLRAEGLGAELPHMEADAVARWFLDSWLHARDVRASDSLELVATQFSIQGLELDHVGLAWDADLVRHPECLGAGGAWRVRRFAGTRWQIQRSPDRIEFCLNTYRVLLTRACYGTIIFVPCGDPDDPSRDPETYDAIAAFLAASGIEPLARSGVTSARDAANAGTRAPLAALL